MFDFTERTELLIGRENAEKLASSSVLVFGLGGVGGTAAVALARAGIGRIGACDGDRVALSNLNRQELALHSTVGMVKTEVFRKRALDINPEIQVDEYPFFFGPDDSDKIPFENYDFVIDCIDDARGKVAIAVGAGKAGVKLLACMGAGGRLRSGGFSVKDLFSTRNDPLARHMRRLMRKAGITELSCVLPALGPNKAPGAPGPQPEPGVRQPVPSISYVPPEAGLFIAGEAVRSLLESC